MLLRLEENANKMITHMRNAAKQIAELETALKPFADAAKELNDGDEDDVWNHDIQMSITCDDLRRARAVLADIKKLMGEG